MRIEIICHHFHSATKPRTVATASTPRDAAAVAYGLAIAHRGQDIGFVIEVRTNALFGYHDFGTAYAGHDTPPSLHELIAKAERRAKELKGKISHAKKRTKFLRPYFDRFPLKGAEHSMEDLRRAIWHDEECKAALDREDWKAASARLAACGFDLQNALEKEAA